jgi:uncharacterized membrane protein (UPF0136 family)
VHDLGRNSLLILSVFVLIGGMTGYAKAKSKASLIAGVVSSVLLAAAFAISLTKPTEGLIAGVVVTTLLDVVFGIRLAKTKSFMPAGLMLSLSLVTQAILIRELLTQTVKIYPTT